MKIITSVQFQENLYQILRYVNESNEEVIIIGQQENKDAVLVSLDNWKVVKETLHLENTGTLAKIRERKNDDSGSTCIDEVDWDSL